MNNLRHSLRFKLALTFAAFGAMVSLLLSLGLSFAAHNLGEHLMDETLRAEMDDYISRRARNPASRPPATLSIQGYVQAQGQDDNIPAELLALGDGLHQLMLNGTPYRVAVENKNGERYFMLFNEQHQLHREEMFVMYLEAGALIMVLLSAWVGWWLAGWVVAPIAGLARRVSQASPEDDAEAVSRGFPDDEVGQLAHVFAAYLKRMRAFIDRERDFTSDVSHELRTPLAIMQGVIELIEDNPQLANSKLQERIERIGRANREMINLTTALLLMARENSNEAMMLNCDVCEVVGASIEMHRHLLSGQTIVSLTCHAHPQVAAERTLFSIVVANLIRNAFSHTPTGSVAVTVEEHSLTVSDTGTGIRGEEIGKVFQRHFKGSGSTGSGIGLSLVKRICDRYGWETIIDSTEGEGTTAQLIFHPPTQATTAAQTGQPA